VIGLGLLITGASKILMANDSENWPGVQGVILTSKVSVSSGEDSDTYGADVTYRYKVKGKRYKGDKVTVSEVSTSNQGRAVKIVKRYPKRKKVMVYYDPDDPETSVLERGISGGSWLMPGVGGMFFFVGCVFLYNVEKSIKKEEAKKSKGKKSSVDDMQGRYGKME